jgi:DNA-binding HxlR family transcriptional regulator
VRYLPSREENKHTPATAATGVEQPFKFLEGRWKLVILFHLFGGKILRFSDLERAIPAISQKMLIQQLRQLERDGIVQASSTIKCRRRWNMALRSGDKSCVPLLTRC